MDKCHRSNVNKLWKSNTINDNHLFPTKEPLLKRPFDFLFSLLGLIVSLPLWLLVALAIYLEDGFPIIFSSVAPSFADIR